jgi:hypothetical protein
MAIVVIPGFFNQTGTDLIRVANPQDPPPLWSYTTSRLPYERLNTLSWNTAIVRSPADGLVYLLGEQADYPLLGRVQVLARLSESDLDTFNWAAVQFWSGVPLLPGAWITGDISHLKPLYEGPYTETTLFW